MKPAQQCPICGEHLVLRDVAPCWDCGHDPVELQHLREKKHDYSQFRVFGHEITLCSFCMVDFSSYKPEYFGLRGRPKIGLGTKEFDELDHVKNPAIGKALVCIPCGHQLKFLNWLLDVRTGMAEQDVTPNR
jgi:hypothetical protein